MAIPSTLTPLISGPRNIPSYVLAKALVASTAASFVVPTVNGVVARSVVFSANVDFYVNCWATATVPGTVTDGTASELNPSGYLIPGDGTTTAISVISASAGIITAAFYA